MKVIATIITEGFADWETAILNSVARNFYGQKTIFASPDGKPVTSTGGLSVTPDMALADLDLDSVDALVVCGGTAWQSDNPPDVSQYVQAARAKGKVVAGICDGTVVLARAGLLDTVDHASNGAGYLDFTGYAGKQHYQDVPHAIGADGVVTAAATAPVSFAAEVLKTLGIGDENLDYYVGMLAAEHGKAAA